METVTPEGVVSWQDYDTAGRVISTTDGLDAATTSAYDLLGRRVALIDPLGQVTHYAYTDVRDCQAPKITLRSVSVKIGGEARETTRRQRGTLHGEGRYGPPRSSYLLRKKTGIARALKSA